LDAEEQQEKMPEPKTGMSIAEKVQAAQDALRDQEKQESDE